MSVCDNDWFGGGLRFGDSDDWRDYKGQIVQCEDFLILSYFENK